VQFANAKMRTILLVTFCSLPACNQPNPQPVPAGEPKNTIAEGDIQDDSSRIYALIYHLLEQDDPLQRKMQELIAACEGRNPEGDWRPLKDLDFEREIPRLRDQWLAAVFTTRPPVNDGVTGLWFGLFNPIYDGGAVADFYVAGGVAETEDENADWASAPKYFPEGRYAHSEVLAAIYHIVEAHDSALGRKAEEYVCLGYVAFVVQELLRDVDTKLVVTDNGFVRVAIGWDSGDALYIGTLTRRGFEPQAR
jgi:hypothetical protein